MLEGRDRRQQPKRWRLRQASLRLAIWGFPE
jgi:hypothetical protein